MFLNSGGHDDGQNDGADENMTAQDRMKALKAAALAKRNAKLKNNSAMMRTQTDAPSWNTNNRPMSKQRARPQSDFAPPGGKGFGGNSGTSSRPQSRTESEKDGDEDYEDQPSGHKWQGQIGAAPEDRDFPEQQQRQSRFRGIGRQQQQQQQEEDDEPYRHDRADRNRDRDRGRDDDAFFDGSDGPQKPHEKPKKKDKKPDRRQPTYDYEHKELDTSDWNHFLTHPVPPSAVSTEQRVKAYIIRVKKGLKNKMWPTYEMYLDKDCGAGLVDKFLLSAKKRSKNKTSNYMISWVKDGKKEGTGYCGKVRANFIGTEFTIFNEGLNPGKMKEDQKQQAEEQIRKELGAITYEQNILGSKGPRKMTVVLPACDGEDAVEWRPMKESDGILANWKSGNHEGLTSMTNKKPKWNEKVSAYVLNFNGRVTLASVKNFQLASDNDEDTTVLQFGRVGKDQFNVDFSWPLSPLQAFAVCLSSFDYKFACE